MPRKPDRFERMIMKRINVGESYDPFFHFDDVIKLLRKEHAWMVRMVKLKEKNNIRIGDFYDGYSAACIEILNQLTQRRK